MKRRHMNKNRGAGQFRQASMRTKGINLAPRPTRGGGRL